MEDQVTLTKEEQVRDDYLKMIISKAMPGKLTTSELEEMKKQAKVLADFVLDKENTEG